MSDEGGVGRHRQTPNVSAQFTAILAGIASGTLVVATGVGVNVLSEGAGVPRVAALFALPAVLAVVVVLRQAPSRSALVRICSRAFLMLSAVCAIITLIVPDSVKVAATLVCVLFTVIVVLIATNFASAVALLHGTTASAGGAAFVAAGIGMFIDGWGNIAIPVVVLGAAGITCGLAVLRSKKMLLASAYIVAGIALACWPFIFHQGLFAFDDVRLDPSVLFVICGIAIACFGCGVASSAKWLKAPALLAAGSSAALMGLAFGNFLGTPCLDRCFAEPADWRFMPLIIVGAGVDVLAFGIFFDNVAVRVCACVVVGLASFSTGAVAADFYGFSLPVAVLFGCAVTSIGMAVAYALEGGLFERYRTWFNGVTRDVPNLNSGPE